MVVVVSTEEPVIGAYGGSVPSGPSAKRDRDELVELIVILAGADVL